MPLKLVTSNEDKLREFRRFGLPVEIARGVDLKEVDGTPDEVIIHKAKDAGPSCIVEDTSLIVEGESVGVNVRWLIDRLRFNEKRRASWTVKLGYNDGTIIRVAQASIAGTIMPVERVPADAFGFDAVFFPAESRLSLYDLEKAGMKDTFSARRMAVEAMTENRWSFTAMLDNIKPWTGRYQGEE